MSEGRYEAVIVGAGIAGLTAGWTLRDRKILALEATDRVGGRMRSEPRGPYWLNLGACYPHEDGEGFNLLLNALPVDAKLVLRRYKEKPEEQEAEGALGDGRDKSGACR